MEGHSDFWVQLFGGKPAGKGADGRLPDATRKGTARDFLQMFGIVPPDQIEAPGSTGATGSI